MFKIGGKPSYDQKNKISMKIPEFKRSGIGLIAEFCGIPNRFPNQASMLEVVTTSEVGQSAVWLLNTLFEDL